MNAPDKAVEIKAGAVGVLSAVIAFFGPTAYMILLMILCVLVDCLTGTAAAKKKGEWDSDIAREGLWHKLGEFVALFVALLLDFFLWVVSQTEIAAQISPFGVWRWYVSLLVAVWYIITELGSITENAAAMGAPVPKWLTNGLAKLHEKTDEMDPFDGKDKPPDKDV